MVYNLTVDGLDNGDGWVEGYICLMIHSLLVDSLMVHWQSADGFGVDCSLADGIWRMLYRRLGYAR